MFESKPVGTLDLLEARSVSEFAELWARYEAEPALLLGLLLLAVLLWARFMTHSPLDRREPHRGTFYLGNTQLGRNPKADGVARRRTRLDRDPEFRDDDPLA